MARDACDQPDTLATDVRRLLEDARALLLDQLHLLALETRRAACALGHIVAYGIAAGILMACSCAVLGAALALWLMEMGARPSLALVAASLPSLAGIWVFMLAMHKASAELTFAQTRKSLQPDSATEDQCP